MTKQNNQSYPVILSIDTSCDPPTPKGFGRASETAQLILAIDTSCDETAVAITRGTTVLSNVIWSQASQHAKFGGVMPSLAQRMHEERIDWVVDQALQKAGLNNQILNSKLQINSNNQNLIFKQGQIEAIAVTVGPGLAIALEVGIAKARELAEKYKLPLIPVNHTEGHLLSPLARASTKSQILSSNTSPSPPPNLGGGIEEGGIEFPALGLVVSGGHTELVLIKKIGEYQILAKTQDDALGEALDKAARMLGLGYPGGAILEKMARLGNPKAYPLPLPMARSKINNAFSYSGLKTAFYRLIQEMGGDPSTSSGLSANQIKDLASAFQNRAFQHLIRVCTNQCSQLNAQYSIKDLLVGGGVAVNMKLRYELRVMGKQLGIRVRFPYSMKLVGDNAAMIGVVAGLRYINHCSLHTTHYETVDRRARWSVEEIS